MTSLACPGNYIRTSWSVYMASSSHELLCHRIGKLQKKYKYEKSYHMILWFYCMYFNQSAQPINKWLHLSEPVIIFTALKKNLPDMLTLNKWRRSKANRPRHRGGSFRSALMSLLRRAESNSDSYTLLLHTHKHIVPCLQTPDLNLLLSFSNT